MEILNKLGQCYTRLEPGLKFDMIYGNKLLNYIKYDSINQEYDLFIKKLFNKIIDLFPLNFSKFRIDKKLTHLREQNIYENKKNVNVKYAVPLEKNEREGNDSKL